MAGKAITGLTALTAPAVADKLIVVDDSASDNRSLALSYVVRDTGGTGAIVTGAYTLTLPATGTAALLATTQTLSGDNTFSGQLNFASGGSSAEPKLAVNEDANTGFYSNSADTLRLTVGGYLTIATDGTGTYGRIAMGGAQPSQVSALLDLSSTSGCLLLTRMTTTQRNALTAVNGMIIYNSTTSTIQGYVGGSWTDL